MNLFEKRSKPVFRERESGRKRCFLTPYAYTLVDAEDVIIGFGQILPRGHKVLHLARLIVDPELRGQGIGRDLCIALMNMGASKHDTEYFTLNVYESNKAWIRIYQSLGFDVKSSDASGAVAMIKPLTKASTRTGFSAAAPKPAG